MLRTYGLPSPDDLSWIEDLNAEEPWDLFRVLPELRPPIAATGNGDELGLRTLLERPAAQSRAWRRAAAPRREGQPRPARRRATRVETP